MVRGMGIKLYYHPFSRASGTIWPLEEVGQPYDLEFVDLRQGAQKSPAMLALNPMGKIPVLVDGDAVITEGAAIALYLADRYAPGKLAPALDDPRRGTYLRWSLFPAAVIEPAVAAKTNNWEYKASQVGWGEYDAMLAAVDHALANRTFLLGDTFSMADAIFGSTLRYMSRIKAMTPSPTVAAYIARLEARPALQRADAKNAAMIKQHHLG